ncbi:MAG TPA: N-6 DNA methylase [Longimicrobium sp.]|uniref:Eco57I restriction-modification methylase domain-containing protein n=1 Tax=Longimicrobium sp. TaxID=2029185 RepID=UPI002ED9B0ED
MDLLQRVAEADARLGGLSPEAYHLSGEKVGEAVSRSWQRLLGAWRAFRSAADKLSASDPGTSVTREKWLLPLFHELGYGRLVGRGTVEVDGVSYPVSHAWEHAPIHLLGFRVELDRRTAGVAGAARTSPHGLVQEVLNRSDAHLWGFLSNGHRLRILRDSVSLARPAYVEWDLEAMMEGEVYPDFVLLWLLCHQSRVEAARPEECWLERWARAAQEQGTRVLEDLRLGVEHAINALGTGFLAHRENAALRDRLRSGELDRQEYYRQLLRVVYRMLFLFVAEDRGLLLDPAAEPEARERYTRWYSAARLRRLAERRTGTRHGDLVQGLWLVMRKLGAQGGCPELGLPALGSFLFSLEAAAALEGMAIDNRHLLDALRALAFTADRHRLRPVDFRNLGSRELGSVYESLLELHPELNVDAGTFMLRTVSGSERKTTGSYYTPESLIQALLDSALDPVLDQAARSADPAAAILALRVCDPACGSGHFLISAAHRIAQRLAAARSPDEEPSLEVQRHALRDVIGHCVYGVDLNPMAVELCKVSLWMEALEPGRPLSFLDHRIQAGNSLLGTTPLLLRAGIPDDAFTPIEGDNRKLCTEFKKQNKRERLSEQMGFFVELGGGASNELSEAMRTVDALPDDTFEDVQRKQTAYAELVRSGGYGRFRRLADAWCAAFVWKKNGEFPYAITEEVFRRIERNPDHLPGWMRDEIGRLREQYQFFHWHLAFPDVFRVPERPDVKGNDPTGWDGGFDVVLGNPPWEHTELKEQEWFAARAPEIANAPGTRRKRMIDALKVDNPALYVAFSEDKRAADGQSHVIRNAGRFPLCGRGRINTYAIFAELNRQISSGTGRVGCIVPSGIATDDTTKFFFQDIVDASSLVSFYDFENAAPIFPGVHRSYKFCLLTMRGAVSRRDRTASSDLSAEFAFFLHDVADLAVGERRFSLTSTDIELLNPNTRTCPIFRTRRDAEITRAIYRHIPVLIDENRAEGNPWLITFKQGFFNMTSDSGLFRTREQLEADGFGLCANRFSRGGEVWLPLYEAKMLHQFDHRWSSYAGLDTRDVTRTEKSDPEFTVLARYWVAVEEVRTASVNWKRQWLLAFRRVARTTDERSALFTILPENGPGDSVFLALPMIATADECAALLGVFDSIPFDYVARQKVGGINFSFYIVQQLPTLPPELLHARSEFDSTMVVQWLLPRVLELTYTAWDLQPFAEDCGYDGPPFRWDEERRFLLRCELDAAFFHLYGIERDDVDYIMDTFPIVRRKDEAAHGEYRTKRVILEIYDEMAQAARTGTPYATRLDPPPADPRVAHLEATRATGAAQVSTATPFVPEMPSFIDPDPADALIVVLALLHASGGSLMQQELARAFALWSKPALLVNLAPEELAAKGKDWSERVMQRSIAPGTLAEALKELVDRQVLRRTLDDASHVVVNTTDYTPGESEVDAWFRFEARLVLGVLAAVAPERAGDVDAGISGEDRNLLAA